MWPRRQLPSGLADSLGGPALQNPKPGTRFQVHRGRLALFHPEQPQEAYWRQYWSGSSERLIHRGATGDLGELGPIIERHVPRDLPVLEAGCGPAHHVAALVTRGYRAIGIDYEPQVVRFVRETRPDLDVREGNILSLPLGDGEVGAYLSFGVVEHLETGPEPALAEARRVLHPRGVALISVPALNRSRARHLRTLAAGAAPAGLGFHQYYFGVDDFGRLLADAGLAVVETVGYGAEAFLTREHPVFSRFWQSRVCRERMRKGMRRRLRQLPPPLKHRYAHMMMFVCRPA